MKLLFATGNERKYKLMVERMRPLDNIEIIMPKNIGIKIDVNENGKSPEENAIIKAKAYYDVANMPVIAEDSGLYIDEFTPDEQPGMFVKRINGVEGLPDEEILRYYIDKLNGYGGKSMAHYETGVCLIDKNGNIYSDQIKETPFLLTTKIDEASKGMSGGVLECISYDVNANKYFAYQTKEDKDIFYKKLDNEYRELVRKHIL